jgi:hypothetical protein
MFQTGFSGRVISWVQIKVPYTHTHTKDPPKNRSSLNSRAWCSARSAITGVCLRLTGLFILANFDDNCAVALAGVVNGGGRSRKRRAF